MAITLGKREKYFVSIAACMIALFLLFQFLIGPFFEKRSQLRKGIIKQEQDLKDLAAFSARYYALKENSQDISRVLAERSSQFMLSSFMEEATRETGISKEHIKSVIPSDSEGTGPYEESKVEIKLEGITVDQLVEYLYRVEDPDDLVFVKRISITDNKEDGYLDSVIQAVTFQ